LENAWLKIVRVYLVSMSFAPRPNRGFTPSYPRLPVPTLASNHGCATAFFVPDKNECIRPVDALFQSVRHYPAEFLKVCWYKIIQMFHNDGDDDDVVVIYQQTVKLCDSLASKSSSDWKPRLAIRDGIICD